MSTPTADCAVVLPGLQDRRSHRLLPSGRAIHLLAYCCPHHYFPLEVRREVGNNRFAAAWFPLALRITAAVARVT